MKLGDIVSFRQDLLFNGAVQIGWLEENAPLAEQAASHYAFHGPSYHGVAREATEGGLRPVDTASFTLDLLERMTGRKADEPFALAVAGYGAGKSHLGVALATLLGAPETPAAKRVLDNLRRADSEIGNRVCELMGELKQPFLVVALNGMKDFDLTGEIVRQVLGALKRRGLDASALEDLRPRFRYAVNFTESLFEPLRADYEEAFGHCGAQEIVSRLQRQDEEAFQRVSAICERKTGAPIRAMGQESLHDLVRVTRELYCGAGRPFAGLLILFDEFGRYLEFSVQRPQVAGPGAMQQLFEAVQANAEGAFLLGFIQYELRAYVSRVAPELRDDLQRYVTRYDAVQKARLSTNLETLIANLLEKRDTEALAKQVAPQRDTAGALQALMRSWYPDLAQHALWTDQETFRRVVQEGCWPLHPLSTWLLYRLAAVGRSLQQRSALSLLADTYQEMMAQEATPGFTIAPVDLCGDALVEEFVASERFGQQGASAQAYRAVTAKYQHQLSENERRALKATLLLGKTNARLTSREDSLRAIALFSGRSPEAMKTAIQTLERDKGALSWNEALHQYEIVSDAVPRAQFLAYLGGKVAEIAAPVRARIFSENFGRWFPDQAVQTTDFGDKARIATKEWNYQVSFANVELLPNQIEHAFRNWQDARKVDQAKGQLIYCYVGRESNLAAVRDAARTRLRACVEKTQGDWSLGAPVAIVFLHDVEGKLGAKVAEYRILQDGMDAKETQRYANFIAERRNSVEQDMSHLFDDLRLQRQMVFASGQEIEAGMLSATLTKLFEAVYPHRIPFPFDGFSTAAGNAAKDCVLFTRELFLGHLDRDWITARPPRELNRAVAVLENAWQAFDPSGKLWPIPGNPALRRVIEMLEARLATEGNAEPLNLGKMLRVLCAPPYGCNLGSAGMALALFVGQRRDNVELMRGGQSVSMEVWLSAAMSSNSLELPVLDDTVVIKISSEIRSEWERLLNAWGIERTFEGRVTLWRKAEALKARVPVPQTFYYQYESYCTNAKEAQAQIHSYNTKLDDAIAKIESGRQSDDIGTLCWGAALLTELRLNIEANADQWTTEQRQMVERHEAPARIEIQQQFASWLLGQKAASLMQLDSFLRRMRHIGDNLSILGMGAEKAALEQHAREVESNIRRVEEANELQAQIASLAQNRKPTPSTTVSEIKALQSDIKSLGELVTKMRQLNLSALRAGLDDAQAKLNYLSQACNRQLGQHKDRILQLYNSEPQSLADIEKLQAEINTLRQLYDGQEQDVRDLDLAQRQLTNLATHYRRLDNDDLSEDEFEALLQQNMTEAAASFGDNDPPLDSETLYEGIAQTIRERRRRDAERWIETHLPRKSEVMTADAPQILAFKQRLQTAPRSLSNEQLDSVRNMIERCDLRLDELEVEGLVAKYEALPEPSRRRFLARIGAMSSHAS